MDTFTNDERREVAEKLRHASHTDANLDVTIAIAILDTIGEVHRPIAAVVADLIDPTCEMEAAGDVPALVKGSLETFFCSECGSPIYNDVNPSYCLYCGHRVVSNDD